MVFAKWQRVLLTEIPLDTDGNTVSRGIGAIYRECFVC
jgi:hypothetical protein